MVCASCGVPAAHANSSARRALPSSPLRCRRCSVGGSGAEPCVCPCPLLTPPQRRSIRLCDWRLSGRSLHAERAATRPERVASVCARVRSRATEVQGRAAVRACCTRFAWRKMAIPGAIDAYARMRLRHSVAHRATWPWWRVRWRDARFARMIRAARRVPMGAMSGSIVLCGCSLRV